MSAIWLVPATRFRDIALRVALTYYSETEHSHTSSAGVTPNTINPPQSVNLDFQTGIAADTLLFGQIRWADWTNTRIVNDGVPIVTYSEDVYTYTLGVGRKFSDSFSAAVSLGYEDAQGGIASRLAPTDGSLERGCRWNVHDRQHEDHRWRALCGYRRCDNRGPAGQYLCRQLGAWRGRKGRLDVLIPSRQQKKGPAPSAGPL